MPRGDGTGPMGMGSMTGRGAGRCTGYAVPSFANYVGGGFGRGMGRGFRRMYYSTGVPGWGTNGYTMPSQNGQVYDEEARLKNQKEFLEAQLKEIKDQLKGFNEEK